MSWTIDTGMYDAAGKKCHLLADDLSLALGPLNSVLNNSCGGMAGDQEESIPWIEAYDKHAAAIVTFTADLANALRRYGDVLEANGYNWWYSNHTAASGAEPSRPIQSEPLYDSAMALPVSAKGDNGWGLTEEGAVGLLELVGKIPNGDATKLGTAKDSWKTFAESNYITDAVNRINGVKATFEGSTDPNVIAIEEKLATLARAAALLAEAARGVANPVSEHFAALGEMRTEVQKAVASASTQIATAVAITVGLIALGAVFTGGVGSAGAAAGGAVVTVEIVQGTATVIRTAVGISRLISIFKMMETVGTATHTGTGTFAAIPDLQEAGLKAAVNAIASMLVIIAGDTDDTRPKKVPKKGTGKEKADDVPSWAKGRAPYVGESGKDYARRLMDEKYGKGNWSDTGPGSEYNKIKKYGDRAWQDPE
ncbi:hypothetical protein [Nocardia sp. NPDC058666]|uniref:hypothetical protein n=1 Tax=Nocardia sp. NPDC058666 TaxID=3346587 RepID=UPI0036624603